MCVLVLDIVHALYMSTAYTYISYIGNIKIQLYSDIQERY